MSSYLVQSGSNLYTMTQGGVATQITLPSGITLAGVNTQPCRAVLYEVVETPLIVVVNGGTHDFYITQDGTARQLQISSPTAAPVVSAGAGTGLSGIYMVAITYKVKDINGNTVFETGLGPTASTSSLANKTIRLDSIPVSSDASVNARGVYRSLTGGNVLYPWFDIDNNTTLIEDRGVVDSLLSLLPTTATRLGAPPDLKLITTWQDRLWGSPRFPIDHVRWTDERTFDGWSADNEILIPPTSSDPFGVTAFIPRRDTLGIARRRGLYFITGNSNDTYQRVGASESLGCVSQESVVVVQNVAYMLGDAGVNEWSDLAMRSVSDQLVNAWFTSDTYFNRSLFNLAQGRYNQDTNSYELLLAGAGSSVLNTWVSYSLTSRTWLGPHLTNDFSPSCAGSNTSKAGILLDVNNLPITVFGGTNGVIYKRDPSNINDNTTAVPLSISLPPLSANEPDLHKYFDRPTIHTRAELQGTLTLTPTVGTLEESAQTPLYHDLTLDREVLGRLGQGRYCQITLTHSSTTEKPRIYGIEIPYTFVGRR